MLIVQEMVKCFSNTKAEQKFSWETETQKKPALNFFYCASERKENVFLLFIQWLRVALLICFNQAWGERFTPGCTFTHCQSSFLAVCKQLFLTESDILHKTNACIVCHLMHQISGLISLRQHKSAAKSSNVTWVFLATEQKDIPCFVWYSL